MASTALKIDPVNEEFAAKITGLNLSKPLGPQTFSTIQNALHRYGVIFFPNQKLEPAALSNFTKNFGTPDIHHLAEHTFPKHPEVRVLSNAKKNGKLVGTFNGGHYWHSDLSFLPETGYVLSLIHI